MSAKENQANQFAVKKVRAAKGQAFQTTKKWKFFMTFTFFFFLFIRRWTSTNSIFFHPINFYPIFFAIEFYVYETNFTFGVGRCRSSRRRLKIAVISFGLNWSEILKKSEILKMRPVLHQQHVASAEDQALRLEVVSALLILMIICKI